MVRNYKRLLGSRNYRTGYSDEQLDAAIRAVRKRHCTIKAASRQFGIPVGTLWNKIHCKHKGSVGHPIALTMAEELANVKHIQVTATWGFPLDVRDIRKLVFFYLQKAGKKVTDFKNNTPSSFWVHSFLKRHKDSLSLRTCQNIKRSRAEVSVDIIKKYFENLKETVADVPPANIFNYDETNLSDNPGTKKCVYKRGVKYPERVQDSSKTAISIMFCGNAEGTMVPAYVVYKSDHLWSTWCEGGPPGTRYGRTKSGWFDSYSFSDWFRTVFLTAAKKIEGTKVLFGDNLSSHFDGEVLNLCEKNNIKFCCLPPNSTHICQPLDVAFYGPLKKYWRQTLDSWKMTLKRKGRTLSKDEFPSLLKKLYSKVYPTEETSKNLKAGFEKCGIYPFNPDKVLVRLPDHQTAEVATTSEIEANTSSAVIEVLKELRGVNNVAAEKRKRKKLIVESGKSISQHDLDEDFNKENCDTAVDKDCSSTYNEEVESSDSDNASLFDNEHMNHIVILIWKCFNLKCMFW